VPKLSETLPKVQLQLSGLAGLNVKLGSVIFQNLGPWRGNGVTAARYIDQVLRPHFARHQNKTFQQDNMRAHTARATRDFLQQNNAQHFDALIPLPLITSMSTTSVNHSSTSSIHRVDQAIDECDRSTCPNSETLPKVQLQLSGLRQ
jgi:hypothetical protein